MKTALYGKIEKRKEKSVESEWLFGAQKQNIPCI